VTDPRVARTREHVLAAAGELLAEEGREGFSIDAVARRSGVARTTIYRHWPELGELLFDTFRAMGHHIPQVDTGSVRGDLVALYGALAAGWETSCIGRCMPVLLDMTRRDPGLRDLHRRFIDERRAPSRRAIEAGVARGELPPEVDAEALVDRIAGPIFYRQLVAQRPMGPAEVERLVDDVLAGGLPPAERQPSRPAR
jgi:AcrR family transcriptional regulator